jgi:hypothetical protein
VQHTTPRRATARRIFAGGLAAAALAAGGAAAAPAAHAATPASDPAVAISPIRLPIPWPPIVCVRYPCLPLPLPYPYPKPCPIGPVTLCPPVPILP